MLSCIQVIVAIFKGFIYTRFGSQQNAYTIAFQSLTRELSYRLSQNHSKDYLISLRYLKKAITLILDKKNLPEVSSNTSDLAIYEGSDKQKIFTKKYIEALQKKSIKLYITKNKMALGNALFFKLFCLVNTFILFLFIFPCSIIFRKKGIYALILLEYVENVLLIEHLKRNRIKHVFYFDASEKDSNLAALILSKLGIKVYKITSEGSLQFHYGSCLITDHLCLTSAYQLDEISLIQSPKHIVNTIVLWPPLKVYDQHKYFNIQTQSVNANNTIGLISSGMWRREERNDVPLTEYDYIEEKLLLSYIKEYLQEFPSYKLFIYLHPIEKETEEIYKKARERYQNEFGKEQLLIPDRATDSFALFKESNLAISVSSSASFERLYCGYNGLFAPLKNEVFPIKNSTLNNIAAKSKQQLFDLITANINLNSDEFFQRNKLNKYNYKNFEYLFNK